MGRANKHTSRDYVQPGDGDWRVIDSIYQNWHYRIYLIQIGTIV